MTPHLPSPPGASDVLACPGHALAGLQQAGEELGLGAQAAVAGRSSRPGRGARAGGQGGVKPEAGHREISDPLSSPAPSQSNRVTVTVTLRTGPGPNIREHHFERSRRVKRERIATAWALVAAAPPRPHLPCLVHLTRRGPSRGLDDDNLQGSLKAVRDAVAEWLGLDDGSSLVRFTYAQARARHWDVTIDLYGYGGGV